MPNKKIQPGTYSIKSLVVISEETAQSVDFSNIFTQIDIFESIYFPVITGFVTVTDANNLISGQNSLPIMGNEIIYIELELPTFKLYVDGKWDNEEQDNNVKFIGRVTKLLLPCHNCKTVFTIKNWVFVEKTKEFTREKA